MLTDLLLRLSVAQAHWMARKLRIYEGMHGFLEGFCPCQAGLDEEELGELLAA